MRTRSRRTVLTTVLFTDIVGSTDLAAELGDRRWRDLVARHHRIVRRSLRRFGGRELDTAGDGFFASFERPADAIRCAWALVDEVRELGIEIRAGLHLGEAQMVEGKPGGIVVNTGARVMGVATAGEVLVSAALRDAVAGSGFGFADRGVHELKGVGAGWHLFDVVEVDGAKRRPPLAPEEARVRRSSLAPVGVGRRWLALAAAAAVVVAGASIGLSMLARDEPAPSPTSPGTRPLTADEERLLGVVPATFRGSCRPAGSPRVEAIATVNCVDGDVAASYSLFSSTDAMDDWFDRSTPAQPFSGADCLSDRSALGSYTIAGGSAGRVACYTTGEGLDATSSIMWTDDSLLVGAQATRDDPADLTLAGWWLQRAGPAQADPRRKDGEVVFPEGTFVKRIRRSETGAVNQGFADEEWVGRYRLTLEPGTWTMNGEELVLLLAKPNTLLTFRSIVPPTFGGQFCPNYESFRWRLVGDTLTLTKTSPGCPHEYQTDAIAYGEWRRVD
jgi:class 3 adenylate cyclase